MPCAVTYTWNLNYDANELIDETDRLTEQTCGLFFQGIRSYTVELLI